MHSMNCTTQTTSTKHSKRSNNTARLIYGRQVKTCGYPNWFCSNSIINYLSCNRVIFPDIMHIENIGMSMVKVSLAFLLVLTVTILTKRGGTLRTIYTSNHSTNQSYAQYKNDQTVINIQRTVAKLV